MRQSRVVPYAHHAEGHVDLDWMSKDMSYWLKHMLGTVGTTGARPQVDTSRAREVGAEIGQKVAVGANEAKRMAGNAGLTTKIKAKMALDDTIEAARIDVDTTNGGVTLSGTVATEAQRTRAVQLAKETDGVREVVDRLRVGS